METIARFSHIIPCRVLQSILWSLRVEKFLLSLLQRKEKTDCSILSKSTLLKLFWQSKTVQTLLNL